MEIAEDAAVRLLDLDQTRGEVFRHTQGEAQAALSSEDPGEQQDRNQQDLEQNRQRQAKP